MTAAAGPIRLVLADDHRLFRESLRALLELHEGIDVVAEAADGEEAVRLAREQRPDVLLLDVEMPGQSVLTSLVEVRAASPGTRVVVLTMHETRTLAPAPVARRVRVPGQDHRPPGAGGGHPRQPGPARLSRAGPALRP